MDKGRQNASACTAKRMPQRNRAAIHIGDVLAQSQFSEYGDRLYRKRLVEFSQIHIFECQSGAFQRLARRRDRSYAHRSGVNAGSP